VFLVISGTTDAHVTTLEAVGIATEDDLDILDDDLDE